MYRMQQHRKDVRIYVRNKARYNPETKERDFLFVDINNFAGTSIGDIKENVRRQTRNAVKIDELFLNNVPLADDRSVAHYNLEDGSILETTSNPFWVSCLYIKAAEVKQIQEGNPCDEAIQKWTAKSLPKKYTLIGVLLNSNNAYLSQPPHFPTLLDFVQYLERLNKKGATMHPNYTQADLAKMELEFHRDFENKFDDPIAAFIDHHAVQLGFINPDEAERKLRQPGDASVNNRMIDHWINSGAASAATGRGRSAAPTGGSGVNSNTNKKQVQICEDCETSLAVVYCTDCLNSSDGFGICLCKQCSDLLHSGATRRRHNIADISQAPKTTNSKPYVPRAFLAPFSILLAMYSALSDRVPQLSMTEDQIKTRAQSLTDTDLQDKQNGKYVGGFDCMENVLMAKGLVKKEASREPTYALTEMGRALGEKLYLFYRTLFDYLSSCRLPKLKDTVNATCIGNRKICLLIDENEREKGRLLKYAEDKGIDAQTRYLPAGDYIWILTPPMIDTRQKYTGTADGEVVLPFIVERKSWEDFENSVNSTRFQRQVNNMLGSGVKNCFYLMEGSPGALRYNATQQHQQRLKTLAEKLIHDYGFYVNYTSSWMKSAQWLVWFTQLIVEAFKLGKFSDITLPYSEYSNRVAQLNGGHPSNNHGNQVRRTHTWPAQLFIDHIFRDELGDISLLRTVREDLGIQDGNERHLLVLQGLEQYNKKRQSTLNKCCTEVHGTPQHAKDIVDRMIGANIHNMVHYDITCYRQLYIQVMTGVYIMRTESDADTLQAQQQFMAGPKPQLPQTGANRARRQPATKQKSPKVGTPQAKDMLSTMQSLLGDLQPANENSHNLDVSSNLLSTRGRDSLDLPPGCSVANIPGSRQKSQGQARSRTDSGQTLRPFTGTGHTLGSGNTSQVNHRPSATVTSESHILESYSNYHGDRSRSDVGRSGVQGHQAGTIDRNPWRDLRSVMSSSSYGNTLVANTRTSDNDFSPTVSQHVGIPANSGAVETATSAVNGRNVLNVDKNVGREDFIDSQNEDRILQEVLNKSKQDTVTVEPDSQDDPELQLALILSSEAQQNDPNNFHTNTAARESSDKSPIEIERDSQDDIDQDLKVAIERSKLENRQIDTGKSAKRLNQQRDIYRDNVNILSGSQDVHKVSADTETIEVVDDVDKQLNLAIEMSKHTNTPVKVIENDSDLLIQEAIIRSKFDQTPQKLNDDPDFQLKEIIERSMFDHTPHMMMDDADLQLKEAIERSKFDHTPQKANNDSDLKKAVERSKFEHTPKKTNSDLEDEMMRMALERSLVEQSPQRIAVKRKLDSGSVQDMKRKLMKSCGEGFSESCSDGISYTDTSSKECVIDINDSQSDVAVSEKISGNDEDVIQIDSQSQELDTEEPELGSKSDFTAENTAVQTPIQEEKERSILERDFEITIEKESEIVSCPDRTSSAKSNAGSFSSPCKTTEAAQVASAVSENMKDSRDDFSNNESGDEGDDLVPPSPDKSSSLLNLSQQSISNKSNVTCKNTSYSAVSQVRTRNENSDTESSFRLESTTPEKESNTDSKYKGKEIIDRYSRGRSIKVDCGKVNVVKAVTSDFNLKTSLLRFVDEDPSDDDSTSENDEDGDSGNESAEDIFQQDKNSTLNIDYEKDNIVQGTSKYTKTVQNSKIIPKVPATTNLVSKSLVKQTGQPLNSKMNRQNKNDSGIRNSSLVQNMEEVNRSVGNIETTTSETEDSAKEIKKEQTDEQEKELNSNCESCSFERDFRKISKDSKSTVIKKEATSDVAGEAQNQTNLSAYDSDMDDVDFNPYLDDSDNDPTYQASKDGSDTSEDSNDDSVDDDIDDLMSKVDPDFLPNISRPKKRRKTPKKDSSGSIRIKKEKIDNYGAKVKQENSEVLKIDTEMDAALAKMLDKEINRSNNVSRTCAGVNDEIYARQMQEQLDCHLPELTRNSESRYEGVNAVHCDSSRKRYIQINDQNFMTENDEEMARRLDEELNKNQLNDLDSSKDEVITRLDSDLTHPRPQQKASLHNQSDNSGLIKELQRRELEKIERLKRTLAEDERLAKMLQENPDKVTETVKVEDLPVKVEDPSTLKNYRKLFSEDRTMREKTAAQVEEYRKLQSQRYQSANTQQYPGGICVAASMPFVSPTGNKPYGRSSTQVMQTDRPISSAGQTLPYNRLIQSQSTDFFHSQPQAGQLTPDNYSLQSQTSSLPFSQSQVSHMTPCSQSKPAGERNNSKCGNCEEKGHTRKDPKCPKYHTAEESARREAQQERRRQQQEEKKREELENINMLARHQKAILDMNNELETEISTIQNNLRQRAVELEKQVNSRVKRIENAEKRKKKK